MTSGFDCKIQKKKIISILWKMLIFHVVFRMEWPRTKTILVQCFMQIFISRVCRKWKGAIVDLLLVFSWHLYDLKKKKCKFFRIARGVSIEVKPENSPCNYIIFLLINYWNRNQTVYKSMKGGQLLCICAFKRVWCNWWSFILTFSKTSSLEQHDIVK